VTGLPAYADNKLGRALLTEILRDPPETRIRPAWGGAPADQRFRADSPSGKLVCKLRRMHREYLERALAILDRQYEVTGIWDSAASKAVFGAEEPDALVRRLLEHGAQELAEPRADDEREAA
jgi:hypothetical protein